MKRKLCCILLCFALLCPALSAFAAGPSLANFQKAQTYPAGKFTDVASTAWYAENVSTAYELNLVKGASEKSFNPNGTVTVAETLALACRLHNIYETGSASFEQGSPWYAVYVDYAVANGIITAGQFSSYTSAATRRQFAAILANALPESALAEQNTVENGTIPDVSMDSSYNKEIYRLYRAGILTGNDKKGTFTPESTIQRSAMAAIVTRMAVPALRQAITLKAIPVESVTLTPASFSLQEGASQKLTAAVLPADASVQTLTWSSSDPAVATVQGGTVTAVAAGTATITCSASNGVSAQTVVTVTAKPVEVTGVTLNQTTLSLSAGDTEQLTASILPANATDQQITWSTTNSYSLSVSSTGKITALKPGSGYVYAKSANGKTARCLVTVTKATVKIVLRDSLPTTLREYNYKNEVNTTWSVTDFRYSARYYEYRDQYTVDLYFSGTKVYDYRGSGQGAACSISWQLYDSDGYVVDSGTCRSPSVRMGEKFRDAHDYIFDLSAGTYYLELHSTN